MKKDFRESLVNKGSERAIFDITTDGFLVDSVKLSENSLGFGKELDETLNDYHTQYSSFGSVSIEPPALGIEQGFDVSLQMMELDGIEIIEALIHKVLDYRRDELFDFETWQGNYLQRNGIEEVYSALAYKTHFSVETLNSLKEIS